MFWFPLDILFFVEKKKRKTSNNCIMGKAFCCCLFQKQKYICTLTLLWSVICFSSPLPSRTVELHFTGRITHTHYAHPHAHTHTLAIDHFLWSSCWVCILFSFGIDLSPGTAPRSSLATMPTLPLDEAGNKPAQLPDWRFFLSGTNRSWLVT